MKKNQGKTKSGFVYTLDPNKLDDFELLEKLAGVDDNILDLPKILVMLLGKEQKDKLYDHVRTEDGRVPIQKVTEEIMDIFTANKEVKN